jgi:hypothetical protein
MRHPPPSCLGDRRSAPKAARLATPCRAPAKRPQKGHISGVHAITPWRAPRHLIHTPLPVPPPTATVRTPTGRRTLLPASIADLRHWRERHSHAQIDEEWRPPRSACRRRVRARVAPSTAAIAAAGCPHSQYTRKMQSLREIHGQGTVSIE